MGGTVSSYTFVQLFVFLSFSCYHLHLSRVLSCLSALPHSIDNSPQQVFSSLFHSTVESRASAWRWRDVRQTDKHGGLSHTHTHTRHQRTWYEATASFASSPTQNEKIRQNKTKQELAAIWSKYNSYWKSKCKFDDNRGNYSRLPTTPEQKRKTNHLSFLHSSISENGLQIRQSNLKHESVISFQEM